MTDLLIHPFEPIYDEHSRILILGTMPSVSSRQQQFYYGHPQNRFWKILAHLGSREVFHSADEKIGFLKANGIALWDVLKSCEIELSKDSSIKRPVANDIPGLLKKAPIRAIFTNGKKADELYRRLCYPMTGVEAICLPSTSPANGRFDFEDLVQAWSAVKAYLSPIG